jgi:hypothetical protein
LAKGFGVAHRLIRATWSFLIMTTDKTLKGLGTVVSLSPRLSPSFGYVQVAPIEDKHGSYIAQDARDAVEAGLPASALSQASLKLLIKGRLGRNLRPYTRENLTPTTVEKIDSQGRKDAYRLFVTLNKGQDGTTQKNDDWYANVVNRYFSLL